MYQGKFAPSGAAAPAKSHTAPVSVGTVVFYTFYVCFFLAFCLGTFLGLRWLEGKLTQYEAAQPGIKAEEVYQEYFRKPKWEDLYFSAGLQDTEFETAHSFASFMEQHRKGQVLAYTPVDNASGDKSYLLLLGEETIGSFSLKNMNPQTGSLPRIPDWQFSHFELYLRRDQSYSIQVSEGHTVLVNGVPLDDSYLQSIFQDENRTHTYTVEGLFCAPEVSAAGKDGTVREITYEEDTHIFRENGLSPDFAQSPGRVRLTFMREDLVVSSEFYHSEATEILVPLISAPENMAFLGWYQKVPDGSGGFSMEQVFPPESSGRVTLARDQRLNPMTLYAQYETIGGN